MFVLWRKTTNIPITVKNILYVKGSVIVPKRSTQANRGTTIEAMILPSETNPDIFRQMNQVIAPIRTKSGDIAVNAPAVVETPFPPLKPKKQVNTCPSTVPTTAAMCVYSFSGNKLLAIKTGIKPFRKSKRKQGIP